MNDLEKGSLADGWRWVRLGEVCDFLDSRRVPVNDADRAKRIAGKKQSQLFPYYGANGQVGWIDDYLFDEPLILLAEDGGNFGSKDRPIAYAVSGRYWVNNHAHVLRPRNTVDFDYCFHALRIRPDVGDLVSGSTRAKLNQEIAAQIPIPLPPLPEQKRIAAILSNQMEAWSGRGPPPRRSWSCQQALLSPICVSLSPTGAFAAFLYATAYRRCHPV